MDAWSVPRKGRRETSVIAGSARSTSAAGGIMLLSLRPRLFFLLRMTSLLPASIRNINDTPGILNQFPQP